jgi:hypothetical protein
MDDYHFLSQRVGLIRAAGAWTFSVLFIYPHFATPALNAPTHELSTEK